MRLDIADMRLFVCIADAGSITQGAKRANLALASASERLKKMEDDVGVLLLTRHPRGVTLSDAGEVLARHARMILSLRERLHVELRAFSQGCRGNITLYANTAAMADYLPQRLASWLAAHPAVMMTLEERTSVDIVNNIVTGIGEAGLVSDAVDAQGLTLEPVADDRLVLIVPPQHLLRPRAEISLAEIVSEPFIGLYPGNALQEHINSHAAALGYNLNYRITMSSFDGFCEMVSNGIGVGILPESVADRFQPKFPYQKLRLTDAWAQRKICFCYKDRATLSPAMRKLLQFLTHIDG